MSVPPKIKTMMRSSGALKRSEVIAWAEANDMEIYLAEGLDDAILGVTMQNDGTPSVLYDLEACVFALKMLHPDWDQDTMNQWFDANIGAALGPGYPTYLVVRATLLVDGASVADVPQVDVPCPPTAH